MTTVPLPDDPDAGQLRKQARDVQRGVRAAVPGSLALVAEHHPDGPDVLATARLLLRHGAAARAADPDVVARARRRWPGFVVWAAVSGGAPAVRVAVELGWDVDALGRRDVPSPTGWESALHHAAHAGDVGLARALLALGADPDVRDRRFDATPLGWARHAGQDELIALLEPLTGAAG